MSSSKIAESDSGAEDDIAPAYTYVAIMSLLGILLCNASIVLGKSKACY